MSPLNRLAALVRGRAPIPTAELRAYAAAVGPLADKLGSLYVRWRKDLQLDSVDDELADAASIQRWEAAGLVDRIRAVHPPGPLARGHADLEAIAVDLARASQLLSNGYRFHSSRARCDGQALMLASEERFERFRCTLERSGLNVEAVADDVSGADRSPDS